MKKSDLRDTAFSGVSALRSIAAILSITASVGGCAPVSPTAEQDRELFMQLCNSPGRVFINTTVRVDGFLEVTQEGTVRACPGVTNLRRIFFENKYTRYECSTGQWNLGSKNKNKDLFHFSWKPEGDESCNQPEIKQFENFLRDWKLKFGSPEGKCLGAMKITQATSKYVQVHDAGQVLRDGSLQPGHPPGWRSIPGYIDYSRTRIIDRESGKLLAEKKSYGYFPSSVNYMDLNKSYCEDTDVWQSRDVLKPR